MTIPARELKRRARCVLEGKYFFTANMTCSLMLYSFLITLVLNYTGLASSEQPMGIAFYYIMWVIMLLLGSLLEVGLIRFTYLLSHRDEAPGIAKLFYAFGKQPDTFILVYGVRYFLALTWFIPALMEARKLPLNVAEPLVLIRALLPVILLILAAVLPAMLASLPFALASYVLLDNPYCPALEALNTSRRLMKGNYMRLFRLWLGFLPFVLLIIGTSGVAILWVKPYFYTTMSQFYMAVTHQELPEEPQVSIIV